MNDTTINLNSSAKETLIKTSIELNIPACEIIKKLIKSAIDINKSIVIQDHLTEYQDSFFDSDWTQFHLRLTNEDHKSFTSARQRLEISVSKLCLVGFLLFFKKWINKIKRKKRKKIMNSYSSLYEKTINTITDFLNSIGIDMENTT